MSHTRLPRVAVVVLSALALLALWARPLLPIDETRYLAVAWEMWIHGHFLVPHLDGQPYSHKPPLLFWLYQAGWWLFGVNVWWPRLVSLLCALAGMGLTWRLAAVLWPGRDGVGRLALVLLAGSLLWALYATLVMFDLLVALCALIGLYGIALAWRARLAREPAWRGWVLLALGIGLGVLAKGPVILLHTLPVALLAPWWTAGDSGRAPQGWRGWYLGVLAAVLGGALLALAWAVPAALAGGPAYAKAIFWGQTADRMVDSFAHRRAWWWYLPWLPVFFFPWLFWPPLWRAMFGRAAGTGERADAGLRFCLAWVVPAFIAFSLISGKQPHYLLPLFPGAALLVARRLYEGARSGQSGRMVWRWYDAVPVALVLLLAGLALAAVPFEYARWHWPAWVGDVSPLWGGGLVLAALVLPWLARRGAARWWAPGSVSALLVGVLYAGFLHPNYARYDLAPIARYLHGVQADRAAVAHLGAYYGEYQFLGRLRAPLTVLDRAQLAHWLARHPDGYVITYYAHGLPAAAAAGGPAPVFVQPYRTRTVAVWPARVLAAQPDLLDTDNGSQASSS